LQPTAAVLATSRTGIDTHPEIEGTGFPFFLGEADRIDGGPQDLKGIEELVHPFTQFWPHVSDWVVADGPGLPRHALSLGALG
jgi:hypothetical protein